MKSFILVLFVSATLCAQRNFDTVQIRSIKITDNIFMLQGAGGNIGVSFGENGIFVIDDQFAPLTEKIKKAIADVTQSNAPVRFILNTHWHGDHTGGNENFGKEGTVIVAHDNVRKRMSVEHFNQMFNRTTPPSPKDALPIVTFTADVTFHLNGDDIHVFHVNNAHTDGDVVIHFTKANVIHTGDLYFTGRYPFIDLSSGGSVDGMIAASEKILSLCTPETKIIPGHGALSDMKGLKSFHDMLTTVRDRIKKLIEDGKSLDEVKTAKPTAEYDDTWGTGFLNPETFVEIVYRSLSKK